MSRSFYRPPDGRREIVEAFNEAEAAALRAARLLEAAGLAADAHAARNIAQSVAARREVVERRWAEEDDH